MKFNAIHIIIYTFLLALFPACELIYDDLPDTKAEGVPVYIRLTISTGGEMGTKANPTGGEDGDEPRVEGLDDENTVNNVTLFLFGADVDINAEGAESTPIDAVIYFPSLTRNGQDLPNDIERIYYSETKEVNNLSEDSYKVLAVVNAGDLSSERLTTLQDVLDYAVSEDIWKETHADDGSISYYFLMSSESVATISGIKGSTQALPASVSILVERLAARVDYRAPGTGQDENVYLTNTGDEAEILGAAICNKLTGGMWMFKRVGARANATDVLYLGDETLGNDGLANNWVIDYDDAQTIESKPKDYSKGFSVTVDDEQWNCLGYAGENVSYISDISDFGKNNVTGVVFEVQYTPQGFDKGKTFYEYKGKLYPGLDDLPTDYDANELHTYTDGICYYTWWIKHANDNNDSTYGTMEYAIVRNNLYQLTVTSISSLTDIQIVVAVKKWNKLDDEHINW